MRAQTSVAVGAKALLLVMLALDLASSACCAKETWIDVQSSATMTWGKTIFLVKWCSGKEVMFHEHSNICCRGEETLFDDAAFGVIFGCTSNRGLLGNNVEVDAHPSVPRAEPDTVKSGPRAVVPGDCMWGVAQKVWKVVAIREPQAEMVACGAQTIPPNKNGNVYIGSLQADAGNEHKFTIEATVQREAEDWIDHIKP